MSRPRPDPLDENPSRPAVTWLLFVVGCALLALFLHLRTALVTDPDAFYHLAHARVYTERGLAYADFPWATISVISFARSDLWYGFHLLLLPFSQIPDAADAISLASAAVLFLFLLVLGAGFKLAGVRPWWLWPFVVLFAAPDQFWRWMMLRPHVLSAGLVLLLLPLLAKGWRRASLACGFLLAFLHLTYFWMVPLIAAVWLACERRWRPAAGWAVAGMVLGVLARPNPAGAVLLEYAQLVELGILRARGEQLLWPTEHNPLPLIGGLTGYAPLLLLWCSAAALMLRREAREKLELPRLTWASFAISTGACLLSFTVASRFAELWVCFGSLFSALALSSWLRSSGRSPVKVGALITTVLVMAALSITRTDGYTRRLGFPPERLAGAMRWLAKNTPTDTIVFHPQWELFAEMLFWNRHNRYLGGMDPVFQYARNEHHYWMMHRLATGQDSDHVSAASPHTEAQSGDTYVALTESFHADYLLLFRPWNPALYRYASTDPRFHQVYADDVGAVVFQLRAR